MSLFNIRPERRAEMSQTLARAGEDIDGFVKRYRKQVDEYGETEAVLIQWMGMQMVDRDRIVSALIAAVARLARTEVPT